MWYNAGMKIRKELRSHFAQSLECAAADGRCGREWECACGACNIIRREFDRLAHRAGPLLEKIILVNAAQLLAYREACSTNRRSDISETPR